MPKRQGPILIVDDETRVISALRRALAEEGYEIHGCTSAAEALQVMGRQRFKVVISDERMPGMDGSAYLALVRERYPETVRMLLTGHASLQATLRAVNSGEIYRFFTKPWDDGELKDALRGAVEKFDLEQENRRLLATVRRHCRELQELEESYPGIAEVVRDPSGAIRIDLDADADMTRIVAADDGER